jgi:hypothetical protein
MEQERSFYRALVGVAELGPTAKKKPNDSALTLLEHMRRFFLAAGPAWATNRVAFVSNR